MTTQREVTSDDDLKWIHDHMKEFVEHQGNWVAVIAQRIVASASTVDEVLDQVEKQGLTEPLVVRIPDDVNRNVYLIA